jgi:3-oxoacyl-[acyl-carrier protein] reductase
MSDRYSQLVNTPIGGFVTKQVGLPRPAVLERFEAGQPVISGRVLVGAAPGGRLGDRVSAVLESAAATVVTSAGSEEDPSKFKALVFDATGISSSSDLHEAWAFFHPTIRRVAECGRIVVLGTPPEACSSASEATAQRALEGLVKSMGKEVGKGATAQLVYVAAKGEPAIESTLRFLLSPKSAYVSAQVVRIGAPVVKTSTWGEIDWSKPLAGKAALVTGAARGIGEAIAGVLARDGAHVIGLDVPALETELQAVVGALGGSSLTLDITAADAPQRIAKHMKDNHGGVDIVVHNAGVTRDKTLGRMKAENWDLVLNINLSAEERIDAVLLDGGLIRANGRIICVSSISGIAGNTGQTNYSTSKAGVIGMVQSLAPAVAKQGLTINAVAPGFIETKMTAAVPFAIREAGRRMNSMSQGGLPIDVAETIAWYASPASAAVNGNVVRVCGQSLLGA